ncbi:MAG TPA: AAA family ATPase [Thermoanaerobaculia bacterium]|nr:AAA family ATPase [Thermoanaerobaculia bacterium]
MAIKRIIPVSSGKGGVGKTTFAINFALTLSRHGRTVLVDLDTGTSAIRNAIDVPIDKDLYHFFRRGEPLANCISQLDDRLDPERKWREFGFIAGPLHLIEEITNFGASYKARLIEAINALPADYVILDMRAGLDANVIDFLPFSNSGILIFTPHLPSATLAASDIVKAILFRKLRLIFSKESPFFETVSDTAFSFKLINDLIDRVEDVYDSSVQNLDAFALDLAENLGDHPITRTVQTTIDEFRVHYVLNLFNGVEDSFNTAVKPFLDNLTRNVSARCGVTNLGWITRSDAIHQANCNRLPALLLPHGKKKSVPKNDRYTRELDDLRVAIGLEPPPKKPERTAVIVPDMSTATALDDHLTRQLDVLKTMFDQKKDDDYYANFDYVTQRTLFTMKNRRPSELGDLRIFTPQEMLATLFAKSNVPTTIDWSELE